MHSNWLSWKPEFQPHIHPLSIKSISFFCRKTIWLFVWLFSLNLVITSKWWKQIHFIKTAWTRLYAETRTPAWGRRMHNGWKIPLFKKYACSLFTYFLFVCFLCLHKIIGRNSCFIDPSKLQEDWLMAHSLCKTMKGMGLFTPSGKGFLILLLWLGCNLGQHFHTHPTPTSVLGSGCLDGRRWPHASQALALAQGACGWYLLCDGQGRKGKWKLLTGLCFLKYWNFHQNSSGVQ